MKFTFKKGEKIFEAGEYARSRYAGSAVFEVLTAGPVVRWTEKEVKELREKEPGKYWYIHEGAIKFQENVTLKKVGRTCRKYVYEPEYHCIYSYEKFENIKKRVILLTEDNYYIYRPAVLVVPEKYYLLVGIKLNQDIFLENTENVEFERLKFPSRIIDLRKRRVYHDGKWRNVDSRESL